ncbi:MAG: hypothetical protein ACLFMW_00770 [Ectothiorhodospira sp.]
MTELPIIPNGFPGTVLSGLALLAGLSGCAPDPELPHYGVWEVIQGTATSETDPRAADRMGRHAVYTRHIARFGAVQCLQPEYVSAPLTAEETDSAPAGLDTEHIQHRITITCQGEPLPADQGGVLFMQDADTLFIPRQGELLHLERRSQGPAASY